MLLFSCYLMIGLILHVTGVMQSHVVGPDGRVNHFGSAMMTMFSWFPLLVLPYTMGND